jgi:hypothetical protein
MRGDPQVDVLVRERPRIDPVDRACVSSSSGSAPIGIASTLPSTITTSRVLPSAARTRPTRIRFLAVGLALGLATVSVEPFR